ncbi:MAG: hypothetical protein JNG83_10725 [Opitutaceae bacterium]|nr:hypothetical protein [Opitutaceae bacterium]
MRSRTYLSRTMRSPPFQAGLVGFDLTPRFHPTCGARGCNPEMPELDQPLLARCLALEQDGRRLVWFGSDLVGEGVKRTDALRAEVADALGLRSEQVVWSSSQTHSSGAIPGGGTGSSVSNLSRQDPAFMAEEQRRFMRLYVDAARAALAALEPVRVWAGRGYCDSVSYNTRLPLPNGGNKFSRHHAEGLQSGKYFDPTIGLVRFEARDGRTLGVIFNFCCHPATMINDRMISPDWVGAARQHIEEAIGGAPAMFLQGFCGDVNCHHLFGTPAQARRTGRRLGEAAVRALPSLVPVRPEPFRYAFKTAEIRLQPWPARAELERQLAARQAYLEELALDPAATWFAGVNLAEQLSPAQRATLAQMQIRYFEQALRLVDAGQPPPAALPITLGAVRIGDLAAALSPGENFTLTGRRIRERSPYPHTLISGDTNGLLGYLGTDDEIDRGGYETYSFWTVPRRDGLLTPPAKGAADTVVATCLELLEQLRGP